LKVDPSTVLLATTRIEAPRLAGSALSDRHVDDVTQLIMRTAQLPRVSGIQIDFDATLSQRPFYRRLITSLRKHLPSDMLISMTALASWCVQDRWLQGLEVDEIVPAIFRMGPTNERFREVGTGGSWPAGECRAAVGTSLDEPVDLNGDRRRVYVFSPAPWNAESITAARRLVRQ
jgi:hypothetical protein